MQSELKDLTIQDLFARMDRERKQNDYAI